MFARLFDPLCPAWISPCAACVGRRRAVGFRIVGAFCIVRDRPWPIPDRPWAIRMRWCDLLFAHWAVDAAVIRRLIPHGLELDLFDGCAYVGVAPFRMEGVTPRGVPALRGLEAFPELNLRTYVSSGGKPGVWFFSLDAGQKLAVKVARRFFHLPLFRCQVRDRNCRRRRRVFCSSHASGRTECDFRGKVPPGGSRVPIREGKPGRVADGPVLLVCGGRYGPCLPRGDRS